MQKKYFHGGNRGLNVGDYILPQSETGVVGMSHPLCRKDRVYVTPLIDHARFFASGAKKPVVYEVVPEGDVEADPDATKTGISFACPKARIIAIKKVPGRVIRRNQNKMRLGR